MNVQGRISLNPVRTGGRKNSYFKKVHLQIIYVFQLKDLLLTQNIKNILIKSLIRESFTTKLNKYKKKYLYLSVF